MKSVFCNMFAGGWVGVCACRRLRGVLHAPLGSRSLVDDILVKRLIFLLTCALCGTLLFPTVYADSTHSVGCRLDGFINHCHSTPHAIAFVYTRVGPRHPQLGSLRYMQTDQQDLVIVDRNIGDLVHQIWIPTDPAWRARCTTASPTYPTISIPGKWVNIITRYPSTSLYVCWPAARAVPSADICVIHRTPLVLPSAIVGKETLRDTLNFPYTGQILLIEPRQKDSNIQMGPVGYLLTKNSSLSFAVANTSSTHWTHLLKETKAMYPTGDNECVITIGPNQDDKWGIETKKYAWVPLEGPVLEMPTSE